MFAHDGEAAEGGNKSKHVLTTTTTRCAFIFQGCVCVSVAVDLGLPIAMSTVMLSLLFPASVASSAVLQRESKSGTVTARGLCFLVDSHRC